MRLFVTACLAVLATTAAPTQPSSSAVNTAENPTIQARGRTLVDDEGPVLALGTTFFWGLWGYRHDRERMDRNAAAIAFAGIDYVRVLAAVGPESWTDRVVDPGDARWAEDVAAFTDRLHDRHGLRVQWTVFGGIDATPTPESRSAAIDRFAAALRGREHKVFAVEIANEGWKNGFRGPAGAAELKALAARVRRSYKGLLATTAPPALDCATQRTWYRDAPLSLVTLHLPRDRDQWRVIGDAARAGRFECEGTPRAYASNEPIGPYSSVTDDHDAVRLSMSAALTWASGVGAYVLHTGAGIRGGGAEDRREGRPANVWEVRNWQPITAALACVRFTLPPDLPAWPAVTPRAHPFETQRAAGRGAPVRSHHAVASEGRFVTLPVGISRPARLVARQAMTLRLVHPLTCSTLAHRTLAAGESLALRTDPGAALIVGEWKAPR